MTLSSGNVNVAVMRSVEALLVTFIYASENEKDAKDAASKLRESCFMQSNCNRKNFKNCVAIPNETFDVIQSGIGR